MGWIERWAAAAAMALAVTATSASAAPSACKFEKLAELPVRFENNRPLVTAQLNGKPETFLLDTGATTSVLWSDAAARLGLRPVAEDRVEISGVGGRRRAQIVTVADFRLGLFRSSDFRLFVGGQGGGRDTVGVLGRDILYRLDIEFDLPAGVVRIFRDQGCQGAMLAYWDQTPGMIAIDRGGSELGGYGIDVKLNGRTVRAMVDSGAPTSIVTEGAALSAGVRPNALTFVPTRTIGGIGGNHTQPVTTATFDKVEISDEAISHAKLAVSDFFQATAQSHLGTRIASVSSDLPIMLVGADFLRSHRVLISSGQNRMYFSYKGGTIFQVVGPADVGAAADPGAPGADAGGAKPTAPHP